MTSNNIVLLPSTIDLLEKESIQAINNQAFTEALEKLDYLLAHRVSTYQICIGKLICLMKLKKLELAEQFCDELLLDADDEHYYDYLEYYIMVLYESGKYSEVIEVIDEEREMFDIPSPYAEKYNQLYDICYHLNTVAAEHVLEDFTKAVATNKYDTQWYLIHRFIKLGVYATKSLWLHLRDETVHPVIKTKIIEILQAQHMTQTIEIEKFNETMFVRPHELKRMKDQLIYKNVMAFMQQIEQENPTLYQHMKTLFDHHFYVRYPFTIETGKITTLVKALKYLAEEQLSLKEDKDLDEEVEGLKEKIMLDHQLYLSITLN